MNQALAPRIYEGGAPKGRGEFVSPRAVLN